jgi:hypothetical protein
MRIRIGYVKIAHWIDCYTLQRKKTRGTRRSSVADTAGARKGADLIPSLAKSQRTAAKEDASHTVQKKTAATGRAVGAISAHTRSSQQYRNSHLTTKCVFPGIPLTRSDEERVMGFSQHFYRTAILVTLLSSLVPAQDRSSQIHLRYRVIDSSVHPKRATPTLEESLKRRHVLIQLAKPLDSEIRARLSDRNIRLLNAIPNGNAFIVSAPPEEDLAELGVVFADSLSAADKIAPEFEAATDFVFEFYRDVELGPARELLVNSGVELRENPDLLPWQLMGTVGDPSVLLKIAADDSVAFIYPAASELIEGVPVVPCAGAVQEDGVAAALAAAVGEGWDGPGKGSATLTYSLGPLTPRMAPEAIRADVQRALAEWSRYVRLQITQTQQRTSERNLDIQFAPRAHGDAYNFDGIGGTLAHTYYPAPPNAEPIGGDLHLDEEEAWGTATDFYSVVLHELGHALGLAHATDPAAVMYPFYRKVTQLAQDDITSIQRLYAAAAAGAELALAIDPPPPAQTSAGAIALSGRVTGGLDSVQVVWSSASGMFGLAHGTRDWTIQNIPLAPGTNLLTLTASDSLGTQVSKLVTIQRNPEAPVITPAVIRFSEPSSDSVTVGTASVRLRGTASHPAGITSVKWRNVKTGATGNATGTTAWDAGVIALALGSNDIVVDVRAGDGNTTSKSLNAAFVPPPVPDTTAPSITINSPGAAWIVTSASRYTISGTARDNVGVAAVTWSTFGNTALATGTTNWSANVPLLIGINSILIRVTDAAGNSSWRTVILTRR